MAYRPSRFSQGCLIYNGFLDFQEDLLDMLGFGVAV